MKKTLEHKKDLDKFWIFCSSSLGEMCKNKESSNLEDGARIVPLSGQSIYTCIYMQCIFDFLNFCFCFFVYGLFIW